MYRDKLSLMEVGELGFCCEFFVRVLAYTCEDHHMYEQVAMYNCDNITSIMPMAHLITKMIRSHLSPI